jgi:DNA-binding Xre family transcriptional regulator
MMATRLTIREAAEKRGITSSYQLMKALNIPPGHASKLWKGEMRMIGLDTIDALCNALQCKPGEFFEHMPDGGKTAKRATKK